MTKTIKYCLDNYKMMLVYAISKVILIRQLTRNPHQTFFDKKHNEVAQNQFQILHLHKLLIRLNFKKKKKIKFFRLYITVQLTIVIRDK